MASGSANGANRWAGVGTADCAPDAGADDGVRTALDLAMAGRTPDLLVLSASGAVQPSAIVSALAAVAGAVPAIGFSAGGELGPAGATSGHIAVFALGGGFSVATASADVGEHGPGGAGEGAAECVRGVRSSPHQVLLVLTDGAAGDQQEVLRGAYRAAGAAVPLVGGAGGGSDDGHSWQLEGGQVRRNAVVAAAVGSPAPFGLGVGHGWQPHGRPMLVTVSNGRIVHALDDRPALDVYLEQLRVAEGRAAPEGGEDPLGHDIAAFRAAAVSHPLGLSRRSGQLIRSVVDADLNTGSLVCAAEVPQGALVSLMGGNVASVLTGTSDAVLAALAGLAGQPALGLLAFDCVARRHILGATGTTDESALISAAAPRTPWVGTYTFGEIARAQGLNGFHNKTLVVLAVA